MLLVVLLDTDDHFFITSMTSSRDYLIPASVATSTHRKYDRAFRQFVHFIHQHRRRLRQLTPLQIDQYLVRYIHQLHSTGASLSSAIYTLSSLVRHTGISSSSFHRSQLSIRGWSRLHARSRRHRPPLTLEVVTLLSICMAKSGYYNAAIATLLSFHCYLRINEMAQLSINDIIFSGDGRLGSSIGSNVLGTVRLAVTKTGTNQSVTITDVTICNLLRKLIESQLISATTGVHAGSLFHLSASSYRRIFHRCIDAFGWGDINYTPHSLRHGGATRDYMLNVATHSIMHRGRWMSEKALKIYVQVGSVLLLDTRLSREQFDAATLLYSHLESVMLSFQPKHVN